MEQQYIIQSRGFSLPIHEHRWVWESMFLTGIRYATLDAAKAAIAEVRSGSNCDFRVVEIPHPSWPVDWDRDWPSARMQWAPPVVVHEDLASEVHCTLVGEEAIDYAAHSGERLFCADVNPSREIAMAEAKLVAAENPWMITVRAVLPRDRVILPVKDARQHRIAR